MENRQIKELMVAMGRQGIKRLRIKKGDWEVEIEREVGAAAEVGREVVHEEPRAVARRSKSTLAHESRTPEMTRSGKASSDETNGAQVDFVTSPMVGVFYPTPSPEDPPFVKIGERVSADTVVCIIEAMKVMNEVKAGVSGVLEEALVERGHPVEFGTKLFKVSPTS